MLPTSPPGDGVPFVVVVPDVPVLEVLATASTSNQVVLFTHHEHLVELAAGLDASSPDYKDALYRALSARYAETAA